MADQTERARVIAKMREFEAVLTEFGEESTAEMIGASVRLLEADGQSPAFPEASYEYPLVERLRTATVEFTHPRLGLHSTGRHVMPITNVEAEQLLRLLEADAGREQLTPADIPRIADEGLREVRDMTRAIFDYAAKNATPPAPAQEANNE